MRIAVTTALFVATAALLTGCGAATMGTITVSATEIAATAGVALQGVWETDEAPEVDCGDDTIDLVAGTVLECVATNPKSGLDYPATVTIGKVDGAEYSVNVVTGSAIVDEGAEDPDAPTVPAADVAALAATALEKEIGYLPTIDCGADDLAIVLGAVFDCTATLSDGLEYDAPVTVTDVTATNYNIDIQVSATPND